MEIIYIFILGVVQGLTEFFPISSSGHLVIFKNFLEIEDYGSMVEVFLHGGTLVSILIFYKKDISLEYYKVINKKYNFLFMVFSATIPAVIFALLFKDRIEDTFFNHEYKFIYIAINYLFCAFILLSTRFIKNSNNKMISIIIAFIIGLYQCIALLPGISRSGITISIALMLGVNKEEAARFSFLIAIPIIFGGFFLGLYENYDLIESNILSLTIGFLTSAIVGYYVILYIVKLINKDKMWIFSIYCFILSIISIINHI